MFFNTVSKPVLVIYILLPLLILGAVQIFYVQKPLVLLPVAQQDTSINFSVYTDIDNQGTSVVKEFKKTNNSIDFKYVEGNGFAYPFAGINIAPFDTASFFDLSAYDHFSIQLSATEGKIIPITFGLYIKNFTKARQPLTCRSMVKEIDLSKDTSEYIIHMSEFTTPAWWYTIFGSINEKTIGAPDYSRCSFIAIQSCNVIKPNVEDHIQVHKICFYKDYSPLYKISGLLILLYYIGGLVLLYVKKVKSNEVKQISIQYQTVWTENRFDVETQKVVACITRLYTDPELDLDKIQQETGIPKNRISDLLKESLDLNFKQFLNNLRINEAKRLLITTGLQVSEIAYNVGYGNISHFNRVFKTLEDLSPVDYRKKHLDHNTN